MALEKPDIHDLFNEALARDSGEERCRFLDEACGNAPQVRERVEALLRAHFEAGSFLGGQSPPGSVATLGAPPNLEPVGTMIGPYKLREILGEGGMGTVYVAEQEKPLRRKVALKVIKPGMDTREVIGRFEAERQALALMDHPNIAKVFDAGATETGRPYFVMELVRGMPITEYCDRRKLPARERIKLFITVCQAIQHAHQRGIIHRDLKPSNVLITLHDGVPVPKMIDFGVAKALNQKLTEQTLYTRHAQMVGTPLYMSPEQAELSGLEIDTRSDVYSLGVLLYELLTGHTPFEKETFSKVGYDEMRRIIREDEPPRPSQRISTLAAEARSTVSNQRATDERQFARDLRGELDWIVMNALEKDRTRRYGSADALAADLQRYLDDQPVKACPPSLGYRVRKFIRRKSRLMGTTTLLMAGVALAVCGPLSAYGVFMLIRGADLARRESVSREQESATAGAAVPSAVPSARAPGRALPGLIPEPLLLPELGRWQLITKKPRGVIRSAVWSPDEKLIALAEANHVRIYDTTNLQLLHVLVAHSQPVTSVAWHPDGRRLASASEDGTVRLWTSEGAPTHLLEGHSGPVYKVAWRPDGEQLASADGNVRLWSADGGLVRVLDETGRHVFGIDWSPDGKQLASVGGDIRPAGPDGIPGDNSMYVWDVDSGTLVRKIDSSVKHSALCVDWRPDGKQLAVGYGSVYRSAAGINTGAPVSGVRIWKIDGTLEHELIREPESKSTAEYGMIYAVAWDPAGKQLAFGGRAGVVRIWNADDQSVTDTRVGHGRDLGAISWKRDGSGILTTSRESVREWNAADGHAAVIASGLFVGTQYVHTKWSPDGKTVAARLSGGSQLFWTSDGKPAKEPDRPDKNASGWWEVPSETRRADGTPSSKLEGTLPKMREWAWSKNGWLAGATWTDATVRIWNDQGKLVATLRDHRGGVESVDWSPNGETLASGGGDSVRLWTSDGAPVCVITGHTDEVYPVAWSPDGQWIASGSTDSTIRLWKPDGAPGPVFRGHQGGIHDIAWSPDSKRIASVSWLDSTLRVWSVEAGKTEWQVLKLDTYAAAAVTLSPSGQPLHGDRTLVDSDLLYAVERPGGAVELMTGGDFRKRFGTHQVTAIADRCNLATAGKDWNRAEAAFDAALSVLADVDVVTRHRIASTGADLARNACNQPDSQPKRDALILRIADKTLALSESLAAESPNDATVEATLADILCSRGRARASLGKYDDAIADLTRSMELRPNFLGYNARGIAWKALGKAEPALADFTKAIELGPSGWGEEQPFYRRAELLREMNQPERAIADHDQAIQRRPTQTHQWYYRAQTWTALKEYQRAADDCAHAIQLASESSSPGEWNNAAWFLATSPDERIHDHPRALELARKAVSAEPNAVYAWNTLGVAEYRNGNWSGAKDSLERSMKLAGEGGPFDWFFLSMTDWQLGNQSEAVRWFEKAEAWMAQRRSRDEELLRFRAEAFELLGRPATGESPNGRPDPVWTPEDE